MNRNDLEQQVKEGNEFAQEILSKLTPEERVRALDILSGFALRATYNREKGVSLQTESERELQKV